MPCFKMSFVSRADAKRAADKVKATSGRLKPYRCCYCDQFHLTSQTAKEQRESRKRSRNMKTMSREDAAKARHEIDQEKLQRYDARQP